LLTLAVKFARLPEHILLFPFTLIVGITDDVMFIVIVLDVSEAGVAQALLELIMQLTTSPFPNVEEIKVLLLLPALTLLTVH
jgi:hypothetical protein